MLHFTMDDKVTDPITHGLVNTYYHESDFFFFFFYLWWDVSILTRWPIVKIK